MQLVDIGRNTPCPCGSGRKFKKCCLDFQQLAVAGGPGELDVARLVEEAIELDDWEALQPIVDRAMEYFERGEPLEHVRFRDDLLPSQYPTSAELAKLCTAGWLRRCELELAHVLDRYELSSDRRDALRLAAHLVRRFGAQSPIVEELAILQVEERIVRLRRVADALSAAAITHAEATEGRALVDWVTRTSPPILPFADWLALRLAPAEHRADLWVSGISVRVCDICLDRLRDAGPEDRRCWALLAAASAMNTSWSLGSLFVRFTPPRAPTADEHAVYEALLNSRNPPALRPSILPEIIDATVAHGDYAGAALLRETLCMIRASPRGR